jgi:hypothetical protein
MYNLDTKQLGPGIYVVNININGGEVGSATFGLN